MKIIINLILLCITVLCVNTLSAQWVQQTRPGTTLIKDIFFINDKTGWACGNNDYMIRTTNGGTNWNNISTSSNNHFEAVYFFDANTGFAAGASPTQGRAWKTTNGGANWSIVAGPISGTFKDIYFVNSSTGWICSTNGIYRTTDGGANWSSLISVGTSLTSFYFINENTGWAAGSGGVAKSVYKSTNGGVNWILQTSGLAAIPMAINFSDANNGRVSGASGFFSITTNGGTNWITQTSPGASDLFTHSFINSATGWAAGTNNIHFTTNSGASWVNQISTDEIRAIHSVSTQVKYAAGTNIFKTTTAGFGLQTPTNFTLTPVSTSQINLSWTDNATGEDSYIIERKTGFGNWEIIAALNPNTTAYQNTGLTSNNEYMYRVYPKKLSFTGAYVEGTIRTLLETPVNQSPVNNAYLTTDTVTFRWSAPAGAIVCTLQVATDASFSNIVYQATPFGSNPTSSLIPSGILQQGTTYYWRVMARNFSTYSEFSATTNFTYGNSNYGSNNQSGNNLYYFANSTSAANPSPTKPSYNWRDTSGSIDMILNGTLKMTLGEGTADDGRFDLINVLPAGRSIRFFGTNYQNVYIGTSGIVAFSVFNTLYYEPANSLPSVLVPNGIFGFWKDLDFTDADVPVNRLCYKVTSDELIITFMRAPIYQASATDYVSFQIIIKHSPSPVVNSKIEVMYNYDQTGSSFITKYNNNILGAYLIGLQGSSSTSQILQYRYLNHSQQLITPGPMFGSNLALAFGPDANALPVELSSFTSQVSGNNVNLNWATASEINNSGFDIERKVSGSNEWKKINFVQGNGTTNESKNYSYEDKNVTSGKYTYRLKQIDFNGNYEYFNLSNEIEIGVPKKFNLSQNYPNPFNPNTVISYQLSVERFVSLKVYDIAGKEVVNLVNKIQKAGYYIVEFNAGNLASGMYFYRIQAGDFSAVKKMVLVK
jgi:photosystem II stability/assembly factor-like uncharacterized protein